MKNWNLIENDDIEVPENIINFLNEITKIYKKYNLSLSHEDGHGSFIIEKYDEYNIKLIENNDKKWKDKIKAKIEEVKDGTYDAKIVLQSLLEKE